MPKKKKAAGAATPNGKLEKISTSIIVEPINIVNMSEPEIIDAAPVYEKL